MIVVADSSVLIGLSSIGCLSLLRDRFPKGILIPKAVWTEVVEQGGERIGAHQVASADWISTHDIMNHDMAKLLAREIDEGEAQAIVLAHELEANIVLLDEREGRRMAKQLGLNVLGTIGV